MMYSATAGRLAPAHAALNTRAAVHVWDSVRGVWVRGGARQLRGLGDSYCDTASALDPLSYLFCLPSDVQRVYSAATAQTPAPPGGQPMGAPQTVAQMTTPGLWTPDQAITAGANATRQANQSFFDQLAIQNNPPAGPDPLSMIPWWVWVAAAAAVGLLLLRR